VELADSAALTAIAVAKSVTDPRLSNPADSFQASGGPMVRQDLSDGQDKLVISSLPGMWLA